MKGLALEKLILGHIIIQPSLLKKVDIDRNFFSTERNQLIFEEFRKGETDLGTIAHNLKGRDIATYCSKLLDGVPHTKGKNLQKYINTVKIDRLKLEILKLIHSGAQSGFFDEEKIEYLHTIIKTLDIPTPKLTTRPLNSIPPEAIDWFWYNRIPSNSLCFLVGDPGAGKSLLSLYMAAIITTGKDWPDVCRTPGTKPANVLMLTAEDNIADTIRTRADAMGADVSRIFIIDGLLPSGSDYFDIRRHIPLLSERIESIGNIKLISFDPITAYMGDTKANALIPVRAALAPLKDIAEKYSLLSLCSTHMNKDSKKDALYRMAGSISFAAAPRATWLVQKDTEDKDRTRRFFAPFQHNICLNPTMLAFHIKGPIGSPHVSWEPGFVDKETSEIITEEDNKDRFTAIDEAKDFLIEALKNGRVESAPLLESAANLHISDSSLKRAKKSLNIRSRQDGRKWYTLYIK